MSCDPRTREQLLLELQELQQRYDALEADREREATYRRLLDLGLQNLPVVLFHIDKDGVRTESMGAGLSRAGYRDHEAIGTDALSEEQQTEYVKRALAGEALTYVTDGMHEGNPWHYFNFLTFDSVRGSGAIGLAIDITDQKEAEASLEARDLEHAQRGWVLQSILDSIGGGVVVADAEGKFTQFNPEATRILGIGSTDSPPDDWSDQYGLFLPDGETPFPPGDLPLTRAIRGEKPADSIMFVKNPSKPEGVWISVTAKPLTGRDGELAGGVAVFYDISDRKRVEAELLAYQSQLRSLTAELLSAEEVERERLAADLHDGLGQVLTLVSLKLNGLLRQPKGAELGEQVHEMRALVQQANDVVRSLTFQLSPPILHDLGLTEAVDWLTEDIHQRYGVKVSFEKTGAEPDLDERSRVVVFRALRELLINVAKHAQVASARVDLHWGSALRLTVRDQGVGFDPAELSSHAGDGFGLFLINERVERLGGRMSIHSERRSGTSITLELPIDVTHPEDEVAPAGSRSV